MLLQIRESLSWLELTKFLRANVFMKRQQPASMNKKIITDVPTITDRGKRLDLFFAV
jgi:hypothetical protein